MKPRAILPALPAFLLACALGAATADTALTQAASATPVLKIDAGKPGPAVSPML